MARRTLVDLKADSPRFSAAQRTQIAMTSQDEIDRKADADPVNPTWTDDALDRAVFARSVRQARERSGLSQPVFAARYHISLSRLRDWERGRYRPDTVAVSYIKAIRHDPEAIEKALAADD